MPPTRASTPSSRSHRSFPTTVTAAWSSASAGCAAPRQSMVSQDAMTASRSSTAASRSSSSRTTVVATTRLTRTYLAWILVVVVVVSVSLAATWTVRSVTPEQLWMEARHPLSRRRRPRPSTRALLEEARTRLRPPQELLASVLSLASLRSLSSSAHRQRTLRGPSSTSEGSQRPRRRHEHDPALPSHTTSYLALGSSGPEERTYPYLVGDNTNTIEVDHEIDRGVVVIDVPLSFAPSTPSTTTTTSRSSYADLAAACTQSIVEGKEVEEDGSVEGSTTRDWNAISLVTVEYSNFVFSHSHTILVQRLRRRFPSAVIVLVHVAHPDVSMALRSTTTTSSSTGSTGSTSRSVARSVGQDDTEAPTTNSRLRNHDSSRLGERLGRRLRNNRYPHGRTTNSNDSRFQQHPDRSSSSMMTSTTTTRLADWRRSRGQDVADPLHPATHDHDATKESLRLAHAMLSDATRRQQQHQQSLSVWSSTSMSSSPSSSGRVQWEWHTPPVPHARIRALLQSDPDLVHYQVGGRDDSSRLDSRDSNTLRDATALAAHLRLFGTDGQSLSAAGHQRVADDLRALVATRKQTRSVGPPSALSTPPKNASGDWGSGDDCHIWYTTGEITVPSTGQAVELATTNNDDNKDGRRSGDNSGNNRSGTSMLGSATHRHALEFSREWSSSGGGGGGSIEVHNPFGTDRMLSLTYLTDANGMAYPKTRILINGQPSVVLHPFHDAVPPPPPHDTDQTRYKESRYVARTSSVGYIPAGTSTVVLDPVQSTKFPFRLLGASLLADDVQGLSSIEFSLETDTVSASVDDDDDDNGGGGGGDDDIRNDADHNESDTSYLRVDPSSALEGVVSRLFWR